jgi:shikimate dehydrogenase
MVIDEKITAIQNCITNRLQRDAIGNRWIAGVVGDAPSHYSKSPALWNAAFAELGMDAIYLPFDVEERRLRELIVALREFDRFMGINVTVPHKVRVMDLLDESDPGAARVRAVNTVVKSRFGRLIGYNTDGEGFVQSILAPQPGRQEVFIKSLKGAHVLLLGAGGSARAVAFHVSDHLNGGTLVISNRTLHQAVSLAGDLQKMGGRAIGIGEADVAEWAPKVGLIINSTTKGQGGLRLLSSGGVTSLEPFSALAPAPAPVLQTFSGSEAEREERWSELARDAIEANHRASMAIAASIPKTVAFYDVIYHPEESVFLRHGRLTGHPTMNGKAMIVNQAVIAFCRHLCCAELRERGIDNPETMRRVLEIMYRAWSAPSPLTP